MIRKMGEGADCLAPHRRPGTCDTHHICAATGSCCGPVGLFLTQDSIPDEEREGTSQFLVWLSYTALATQ